RADREEAWIIAEAEGAAQRVRGEGDAPATRIYAQAANKDPGFYAFQRSLEAYRKSFADGQGVIVMDRDDPFLQYLKTDRCSDRRAVVGTVPGSGAGGAVPVRGAGWLEARRRAVARASRPQAADAGRDRAG